MRRSDIDKILSAILNSNPGISGFLFCVGRPFQVESFGSLKAVDVPPHIQSLTPYQTEQIALNIMGNDRRLLSDFIIRGACDCSYSMGGVARFRVNIFRQRGNCAIVMRKTESKIPTLDSLGLPPIFKDICREHDGLILVTGASGAGKTTTLSAMLNEINETQAVHVVTLEDPIEFIHTHKKASFNQRELGVDFESYPGGLRAALRQAPRVILVGEMRDRATVDIALTAAETGHLVLSSLDTVNAGQAINRILGMFDRAEEVQLRTRVAELLRFVISQRLAPNVSSTGRVLLHEIMGSNLRIREAVCMGESDVRSFYDIIEVSTNQGWLTFDQSIGQAFEAGQITEETAHLFATNKARVTRYLDPIKRRRGTANDSADGMQLDSSSLVNLR